jgi:glucose uptake protein GlcU
MEDQNEDIQAEDEDTLAEEEQIDITSIVNKLARTGFYFMLSGPSVLVMTSIVGLFFQISDILANIIGYTAFFLPIVGVVLCLIANINRDKFGTTERAFVIITFTMCNPIFYLFYAGCCYLGRYGVSALSMM